MPIKAHDRHHNRKPMRGLYKGLARRPEDSVDMATRRLPIAVRAAERVGYAIREMERHGFGEDAAEIRSFVLGKFAEALTPAPGREGDV